jgi:hypothetical protein
MTLGGEQAASAVRTAFLDQPTALYAAFAQLAKVLFAQALNLDRIANPSI